MNNLVISTIPNYVNNSEHPIVCDKYNKAIKCTVFYFNKNILEINKASNTPYY